MGLVVYWYDFVCFGIVGAAFVGALCVIWRREGARNCSMDDNTRGRGCLWSSCWRGLHPLWLLALRFASFVILSLFLASDIILDGSSVFVYYTEWTFTLVIVYFAIGTVVSAHGCLIHYWKKRNTCPFDNGDESKGLLRADLEAEHTNGAFTLQLQHTAGFWGYLMQIAYQTCGGAVIITDLMFWCIIVPFLSIAHLQLDLLMGCMHILNALFLLLDAAVNSLSFPWFRLAYFVLWSCCYVIFQWVIHACGYSMWPYPFLELSTPWAPLWYLCLAVVHIPCYGLFWLLIRAKNTIFSTFFLHSFVNY